MTRIDACAIGTLAVLFIPTAWSLWTLWREHREWRKRT